MAQRRTWAELKRLRPVGPVGSAEYDRARQAIDFGMQVWERRQKRGESRTALAREAGTNAAMIERVELGDPDVRPSIVAKLAAVLGLELSELQRGRAAQRVTDATGVPAVD